MLKRFTGFPFDLTNPFWVFFPRVLFSKFQTEMAWRYSCCLCSGSRAALGVELDNKPGPSQPVVLLFFSLPPLFGSLQGLLFSLFPHPSELASPH